MNKHFDILVSKLDSFIRRYYLNQLIKGSILFGAGILILFILFVAIEYFGYLGQRIRFILFYGFLLYNLLVFTRFVLMPFLGMIRIGKRISPEQAASILGRFFPEQINDKITNVLQLKQYLDKQPGSADLILAGIEQKSQQSLVLPFNKAIPLRGNTRFLPYFLVPLLLVTLSYLFQPTFILEPTRRIVQYDTHFERPTPFIFQKLSGEQGFRNEDHEVTLQAIGDVLPSEAHILLNNGRSRMGSSRDGVFSHTIRNLQNNLSYYIESQGYRFGPFHVSVSEKASFSHFHIKVDYPEYTGLQPDQYTNMGDLMVIEGSSLEWTFFTNRQGMLEFYKEDIKLPVETIRDGEHRVSLSATGGFRYTAYALDEEHGRGDSLKYQVGVQRDAYPRIAVEEYRDDVLLAHLFYRGSIEDDFGFSQLRFSYRLINQRQMSRGEAPDFTEETLEIDPHMRSQTFYHHFDLQSVYIQPGETIELFFTVYDNDPINGPKATNSQLFTHYIPTEQEILAQRRETEEQIEEGISEGIGEVRDARDQLEELRRNLLDTDRIGWEEREMLQELLNKREEMEERIKELSEMKKDEETRSEQFRESNEKIKKKQEELQKLFDDVLSDEMKDLFDKIRMELDQMDRDAVYEMLDQMDFELRDFEMQLDRALEMFRQFAMERMLQESIDALDKLAEEQQQLHDEMADGSMEDDEAREEQERISDGFEQVQEMLDKFRETNEELRQPKNIDDTTGQEEEISQDLMDALEQMMQDNMGGAMPFQQDAGNKMQELSEGLKSMQMEMFQQQLAEDARAIRQLLENLLRTSFSQEDLMLETRQANVNDPRYQELIREQRKIQADMVMIKDSLVALGQRQMAIQSFVHRETAEINRHITQSIDLLINRRRHQGANIQQQAMTHINNLALMLNESLQEVQQQMAMGQGMGEDMQMGEGMPSFQDLREMQEQLNEMLEQMREGHQPMPGESGQPQMGMSEQMARMAAEQEAIRNKLKELADEMRNQGREMNGGLEELQRDMERTELDMLRKQISRQTMLRQENILTRLLEHERAERQQETEERREGTTAENYLISNPEDFFEYNRIREREVEMLRSMPPGLRPFYRTLVEQYFLHVE